MQAARKPDSVLDDHSSRRRVTAPLQQPTRKFRLTRPNNPTQAELGWGTRIRLNSPPGRIGPIRLCPLERADAVPAYLVLLRVGFTMQRPLLAARCALTAPFHPYLPHLRVAGGMFSVALAVQPPSRGCPGRYPAHCPAESGLSSPLNGKPSKAAIVQPPALPLYGQ